MPHAPTGRAGIAGDARKGESTPPTHAGPVEIAGEASRHPVRSGLGVLADEAELIRLRADMLGPEDRALVMLYLDNGRSFRDLACLTGVSEATIARRAGRIIRRLMDGQYITCLRNRDRLGPLGEAVAKDYLLDGFPIHAIAVRRGISVYRVRKTLNRIRRLLHDNGPRRRNRRCPAIRRY